MQCYGLYRGQVVSNKDPLSRRRLKVQVPAITGDSPSSWAWPLETSGLKADPPSVGQGVWVMFENGDPAYPIWVGVFGKVVDNDQHVLLSPDTTSGTYLIKSDFVDGKTELDLVATLKAISDKLDDLEANKADSGHSHPGL